MTVYEQRLAALERGNETRVRRRKFHAELRRMPQAEARAVLADALATTPDWLASADVDQFLGWLPHPGQPSRVEEWLEDAALFERRTLRQLTERQRKLLCELLQGATKSTTGSEGGEG